jgi:hypothetical protein
MPCIAIRLGTIRLVPSRWLKHNARQTGRCVLSNKTGLVATTRAIYFAVVVEVVLTVVFLPIDVAALLVLRVLDMGTFPARHHTIGFSAVFHILDMLLAALQAVGFALGDQKECGFEHRFSETVIPLF